ncbi:ABC transporter transmembrane domain-containing protein [Escherichia coli]
MWYYSPQLTLVILLSLPCYVIWSLFISPLLRRRLDDKFIRNAENQAFLVEMVTAINTIKSMAVSPQIRLHGINNWPGMLLTDFRVNLVAMTGQQGIQLIQKSVMVISLWMGAHLVIWER